MLADDLTAHSDASALPWDKDKYFGSVTTKTSLCCLHREELILESIASASALMFAMKMVLYLQCCFPMAV